MTERRGEEEERKSKEMSSCQVMRTGTIIEIFLRKIRQSSTLTTAHKLHYCMRLLHRDNDSCEFIVILAVGLCLGGRGDVKKGGIGG